MILVTAVFRYIHYASVLRSSWQGQNDFIGLSAKKPIRWQQRESGLFNP
jgi:hypothetical protein